MVVIMKYYEFEGPTIYHIIMQLSEIMSEEDAIKFVQSLKTFASGLDEDEKIEIRKNLPSSRHSLDHRGSKYSYQRKYCRSRLFMRNYYINLKATTITLIALVLDITVTQGFANAILALTGVNLHAITRLSNNEKCFVMEALKNKSGELNSSIFYQCRDNIKDC